MDRYKEVRALLKGWEKYLQSPMSRDADPGYLNGVRACVEALKAVLGSEEDDANYTCDKCKKPVQEPIYQLTIIYNDQSNTVLVELFHYNCLREWIGADQ